MKKIILALLGCLIILIISISLVTSFYFKGAILYVPKSGSVGIGNQLFQYSGAYALAKKTGSKLYVVVDKDSLNKTNIKPEDREFELAKFNIPKEQFIHKNIFLKLYFKIVQSRKFNPSLSGIMNMPIIVDDRDIFTYFDKKNNGALILGKNSYFSQEFLFSDLKKDLLQLLEIKGIDKEKFKDTVTKLSEDSSVCIHIRKGDFIDWKWNIGFEYQKKAMMFTEALIELPKPKFYVFSDEIDKVKEYFAGRNDVEFISNPNNKPLEELYLMSKCGNNIITNSTFGWWAAYLNTKPYKIIVAPMPNKRVEFYNPQNAMTKSYFTYLDKRTAYPKYWFLLDYKSKESQIYRGDLEPLKTCIYEDEEVGSSYCKKTSNYKGVTIVSSYYDQGNKDYLENLLKSSFQLVLYTSQENVKWIKDYRGDLPLHLIIKDKADILEAMDQNPYNSEYFAWADMSLFANKTDGKVILDQEIIWIPTAFNLANQKKKITSLEGSKGIFAISTIDSWQKYGEAWKRAYANQDSKALRLFSPDTKYLADFDGKSILNFVFY